MAPLCGAKRGKRISHKSEKIVRNPGWKPGRTLPAQAGTLTCCLASQQFSVWLLPPEGGTTNGRKPFVVPASEGQKNLFGVILTITVERALLARSASCRIVYVMHTKLTLRIDKALVQQAKSHAARQGKSVSQMFGEFVTALGASEKSERPLPPVTASLLGVMKGHRISEKDYKKHLREKLV